MQDTFEELRIGNNSFNRLFRSVHSIAPDGRDEFVSNPSLELLCRLVLCLHGEAIEDVLWDESVLSQQVGKTNFFQILVNSLPADILKAVLAWQRTDGEQIVHRRGLLNWQNTIFE